MSKRIVSMMMLFLMFLATPFLGVKVQPARAQELLTIYIRADGSIDPPDAPISTADNITYTLTGSVATMYGEDGIVVERDSIVVDGSGFSLYGSGWYEGNEGIEVYGRSNVTITNVVIPTLGYDLGIYLGASLGCAVHNVRSDTHRSIVLSGCTSCNVFNCTTDAVYLMGSDGNSIYDNQFHGGYGMWIWYSSNNSIFRNNVTEYGHGFWLMASSNNSICYNDIENVEWAFWVDGSSFNGIFRNSIANNGKGFLMTNSSDNSIYHNNLINNTLQVSTSNSTDIWDNGYPSGGNYWSNYNGTDANDDDIGDTPYVIDESSRDNYPIMGPYPYFPWDLSGDGYVGIDDILEAAQAFGSTPELPRWNPKADINHDNYTGIDDILSIARNFGRTSPP
jgi:parallel beta-helix repeat protein